MALKYNSSGTGKFTHELTTLWPGSAYRVRAYAINSIGTAYGDDVGFRTPIPEVTTGLVTIVSKTAAAVVGRVTLINISDIIEGVCYGMAPAPTVEELWVLSINESGTFTCNLQNLIPGTQYYVRAYVSGPWEDWPRALTSFYCNEIKFAAGDAHARQSGSLLNWGYLLNSQRLINTWTSII
jgi:hypothetical protein